MLSSRILTRPLMTARNAYRYEGQFCDFYDSIPACAERPDHDFYVGYARAAKGPTLELGCGTGRILIPTAAAGCRIVGLDFAPSMLNRCAEKLRQQLPEIQKRVRLVRGDMTRFSLHKKFALVTIPFRGFQHLQTVKEQLACLGCVRRHLRPGGLLVFDLLRTSPQYSEDRKWHKEIAFGGEVALADGRKFRVTSRVGEFHPVEQYNDLDMIFYLTHPGGKKERIVDSFPFRYVFRFEAEHLLARSGFRIARLFGEFSKAPVTEDSVDLIFVAQSAV
jgi:SAM-dependent methyltransferase